MTLLAGLDPDRPVLVAAGCGGTGRELAAYGPLDVLGGFVTRSLTLDPRLPDLPPRVVESPSGLVHTTGLENPGLDQFLAMELPWLVQQGARVVVSIVGSSLGEYAALARRLGNAPGVAAVEVNLSPPDTAGQALPDAPEPFNAANVVTTVRRDLHGGIPVLAKLRSEPGRVAEAARAVADVGADAVVVGNALPALLDDRRPAGLGGPAVQPVALRCLAEVREALPDLVLVGCGGVASVADARAVLDAGAVAVQVGTAMLHDPTTAHRLAAGLDPTAREAPQ